MREDLRTRPLRPSWSTKFKTMIERTETNDIGLECAFGLLVAAPASEPSFAGRAAASTGGVANAAARNACRSTVSRQVGGSNGVKVSCGALLNGAAWSRRPLIRRIDLVAPSAIAAFHALGRSLLSRLDAGRAGIEHLFMSSAANVPLCSRLGS